MAGLGGHFAYAFVSLAWLLAPLWFFGFGAGEWLRNSLRSQSLRVVLPALLGIPYLVSAIPARDVHGGLLIPLFLLPVTLAALGERAGSSKLIWQDGIVLATLMAVYMLRLLAGAWPFAGVAFLPKLFVADLALYLYAVVRRLEGIGYAFTAKSTVIVRGLREWVSFLPFGIGLGLASGFIHFHARLPSISTLLGSVLATFIFVAIPEELFFRGILQNLLETRLGRRPALLTASLLFGLPHFNKGAVFNWRYVLLAALAGFFYGRAWRAGRQLLASIMTHTAVDVVWSLWFR